MKENELLEMNDQESITDLEVRNADEIKGGEYFTISDETEEEEAATGTTVPIKIRRPGK